MYTNRLALSLIIAAAFLMTLMWLGRTGKIPTRRAQVLEKAKKEGHTARARLVETFQEPRTRLEQAAKETDQYRARYEYEAGGKTYVYGAKSRYSVTSRIWDGPPPEYLDLYWRKNPKKAFSETDRIRVFSFPKMLAASAVVLCLVYAMLIFWKLLPDPRVLPEDQTSASQSQSQTQSEPD